MASPTGTPKGVLDVFKSDVIKSLDALYRLRPGKPNRLGGQLTEESYTRLVTSLADAFKFLKSQVDDPAILQAHQLAQSPNVVTVDEFEETTALGVACQVTLTVYLGLVDLLTAGTLTEKFSQIRKVEQQFPLAKLKRVSGRLDSEVVAVCRLADSKKPRKTKSKGKPGRKTGDRKPDEWESEVLKAHRHGQSHEETARMAKVTTKDGRPDALRVRRIIRSYKAANPDHKFASPNS